MNFLDMVKEVEQKAVGLVGWVNTHSDQIGKLTTEIAKIRSDLSDLFKQVSDLKDLVQKK